MYAPTPEQCAALRQQYGMQAEIALAPYDSLLAYAQTLEQLVARLCSVRDIYKNSAWDCEFRLASATNILEQIDSQQIFDAARNPGA